jgi:hypothetical protein
MRWQEWVFWAVMVFLMPLVCIVIGWPVFVWMVHKALETP